MYLPVPRLLLSGVVVGCIPRDLSLVLLHVFPGTWAHDPGSGP